MSGCRNFAAHSPEDRRQRTNGLARPKAVAASAGHDTPINLFCTAQLTDIETSSAAPNGG
jgi:hypothetical protein